MEKKCTKCNISKSLSEFYIRKNGIISSHCKSCCSISCKEYRNKNKEKINSKIKKWQNENKDKRKISKQKWIDKNPDYHKNYRDAYYLKNPEYNKIHYWKNPEKYRQASKDFRKNNPKYSQEYISNKTKLDVSFRIARNMRCRIIYAVKQSKTSKSTKTTRLLGCTIADLKSHLESKFLPTMTWENYGKYWHIDHIIPCNSFDLTKEEEQKKCFHYTNLQPLFVVTQIIDGIVYIGNLNKGSKII